MVHIGDGGGSARLTAVIASWRRATRLHYRGAIEGEEGWRGTYHAARGSCSRMARLLHGCTSACLFCGCPPHLATCLWGEPLRILCRDAGVVADMAMGARQRTSQHVPARLRGT